MLSLHGIIYLTLSLLVSLLPLPSIGIIGYFGDEAVLDQFRWKCSAKSRDLGACIHKYLEKDFLSISPIVYPKVKTPDYQCFSREEYDRKNQILLDGPTLQNSCNDLYHVLECMLDELHHCASMESFFQMRHLVYSLKKLIHWLCGRKTRAGEVSSSADENQHASVRARFLALLESIKCIECVRTYQRRRCISGTGVSQDLSSTSAVDDISLWHNILRLNVSFEQCHNIKERMKCLQKDDMLPRICGRRATEIHRNLTELFVITWCDSAPFPVSDSNNTASVLSTCLLLISSILTLLISQCILYKKVNPTFITIDQVNGV